MKIRFKAFYFIQFLSFGVLGPYLAFYLSQKGFTGGQIGLVIGIGPILTIFFQPVWSALSDLFHTRRLLLIIGCLGVSAAMVGLDLAASFGIALLFSVVFSIFSTPINPIGTATLLDYLDEIEQPGDFGLFRVWGSIGYTLSSMVLGSLFLDEILTFYPWLITGIYFVLAGISLTLPEGEKPLSQSRLKLEDLSQLVKNNAFMFFLSGMIFIGGTLNIALIYQAIFLRSLDASDLLIGVVVSLPSLLEIPMMMTMPQVMKRISMRRILLVGALLLPFRWFLFYIIQNPGWMIPVQLLNFIVTISFEVVGISFVDKSVPAKWRATGQGLYASAMYGIGPGIGNFVAGNVMERFNVRSIWLMNLVLGLIGLALVVLAVRHSKEPHKTTIGESKNAVDP